MDNENFTLMMVLLLAQNKELMKEIAPVLSFLEEHKDSLSLIQNLMEQKRASSAANAAPTRAQTVPAEAKAATAAAADTAPMPEENGNKKGDSPLQGIASEEVLKEIQAYLSSQK